MAGGYLSGRRHGRDVAVTIRHGAVTTKVDDVEISRETGDTLTFLEDLLEAERRAGAAS